MAGLFGVNGPAISEYIDSIFESGELEGSLTVSKMEIVENAFVHPDCKTLNYNCSGNFGKLDRLVDFVVSEKWA